MDGEPQPPNTSTGAAEHTHRLALENRFEFLEELGSGAAGTVFRARAQQAIGDAVARDDIVAVKVLRADRITDPAARSQLAREAAIGRSVRSDYVIRIHAADGFDDESIPAHIVMEYVRGRTLRTFLRENGPAQGALARRIGEHAARGLAALHERGIVHRDLKPENLLWTDESELKVMDLGLARSDGRSGTGRSSGENSSSGGFHGSFAYAAPEVLRGRPYTAAADLYALGLLLFEVVTGRHPFEEAVEELGTGDAMIHAHLETPPPRASHFAPKISPLLDVLLGELLEKDPTRRFGPALEVAQALALGERSNYWRRHEQFAPVLASRRRLQVLRVNPIGRFVDREPERRLLDAAARRARRSGRGTVIHVTGTPGVGRRRLCDEWVTRQLERVRPPLFLGGRAARRSSQHPATPFPEMLLDYFLRGDSADSPRAAARLETRVTAELGWDPTDAQLLAEIVCSRHPEVAAATQAEVLVRAMLDVMDRHAQVILRVDRTSRLHGPAALVARAIGDRVADRAVVYLVVGGGEPVERPIKLHLRGLPHDAFVELGESLFQAGSAPTELLEDAWSPLAGNPRALIATLEDSEADGQLRGRPGSYSGLAPAVTELRPARTILARLQQRVAEMPTTQRFILQNAAVLGRRFRLSDLHALTGRPELELLEALGSFDGRIANAVQDEGAFTHRDYRRALLASLDPDQRRRLHRAAGWLLEDRGADPLEIGMHFSRAMLDAECVPLLIDGAEQLVAAGRRRGALRILERARLHVERLRAGAAPRLQTARIALLAGQIYAAIGEPDKARGRLREAVELADAPDALTICAKASLGLAELELLAGHFVSAIQLLCKIEDLGEHTQSFPDPMLNATIARSFGVHSQAMAFQGQTDTALELVTAGLERAPADDDILRAHLEIDLARWLALHTRFADAHAAFVRSADHVDLSGDAAASMRLLLHGGRFETWLGARHEGEAKLLDCAELADRVDDARMGCRAHLFLGEMHAIRAGEDEPRCAEWLRKAEFLATQVDDRVTVSMARALRLLSTPEDVTPTDADRVDVPLVELLWQFAKSTHARRRARFEDSVGHLDRAMAISQQIRAPLSIRIALLRAAGREAAARRLPESVVDRLPRGFSRRRFLANSSAWRVR